MAYIGREPQIGNFQVCDAISVVNGQAAYTMQVSSVNVSPETANHMLVSLNGVLQAPTSSYTVSGSTITFASNLVTGDVINFIHILGSVLDLGVPSDSTVSLAKLTATGTKNSTTFLRGDNTFAEAGGGGIENITTFRLTTNFTMAASGQFSSNLTTANSASIGTLVTNSSGTFSFPQTGIWSVEANHYLYRTGGGSTPWIGCNLKKTTNNSSYADFAEQYTNIDNISNEHTFVYAGGMVDVTDISNVKVQWHYAANYAGIGLCNGSSTVDRTYIRFIRLGDT